MRFSAILVILIVAILSLGGCAGEYAAGGARSAYAASTTSDRDSGRRNIWNVATPFGIIYGLTPHETVDYRTKRAPGTIIVDTGKHWLYYVQGDGKAIRYNIAVGMEGYDWAGTSTVSAKREWPDWTPTPHLLKRLPNLPHHMDGGPDNPLGARALYLGGTYYRIHGTNEPWKIGTSVSSGCIRMSNEDVIDLYDRTKVGATVVVRR